MALRRESQENIACDENLPTNQGPISVDIVVPTRSERSTFSDNDDNVPRYSQQNSRAVVKYTGKHLKISQDISKSAKNYSLNNKDVCCEDSSNTFIN